MHTVFRVDFLTNCLNYRKGHLLATSLGSRKLGTIKLQYRLHLKRASLNHCCHNTYLLLTSSISPRKALASLFPKGCATLTDLLTLNEAFHTPETCLFAEGIVANASPLSFWERVSFLLFTAVENTCWLFPLRRQLLSLTTRHRTMPSHFSKGRQQTGAEWRILFLRVCLFLSTSKSPDMCAFWEEGGCGGEGRGKTPQI